MDDHGAVLLGDPVLHQQPGYGIVGISGWLEATGHGVPTVAVPKLGVARAISDGSIPLFEAAARGIGTLMAPWLESAEYRVEVVLARGGRRIDVSCVDRGLVDRVDTCMQEAATAYMMDPDCKDVCEDLLARFGEVAAKTRFVYEELGQVDGNDRLGQAGVDGVDDNGEVTGYVIKLDIDDIKDLAMELERTDRDVIHHVVAHEYAHNILHPTDTTDEPPELLVAAARLELWTEDCD